MTAENPIDLDEFLAGLEIPRIISEYSQSSSGSDRGPFTPRRTFSASTANGQPGPSDKRQFARDDYERYSWRPKAIAMGSLIGMEFIQMLGLACDIRDDHLQQKNGHAPKVTPRSLLAFDLHRETLYIKARLMGIRPDDIPPALRPLDCELSFDDIAAQGIKIDQVPKPILLRNGSREDGHEVTVTISVRRPPKFFSEFEARDRLYGREAQNARRRATAMDFVISGDTTERDAGPLKPVPDGPCAFPTFWNTYRWIFDMSKTEYQRFMSCTRKIHALAQEDPQADLIASRNVRWRIIKLSGMGYKDMFDMPAEELGKLPFPTRTLIEGLISHGILIPGDVPLLLQTLDLVTREPVFKEKILESLFNEERIRKVDAIVKGKARFLRAVPPPSIDHLVMIRTVIVTPTRVLVGPPQQEASNSVTRRYSDRLDAVVRVVFTDEEDRLFVQEYTKQCDKLRPDLGVIARVRRALQHGLQIGGQLFLPVASSASQQKDHALWFVDRGKIDLLELKKWMGDLRETIVAKHAARMGLPFSTSRIVNLDVTLGKNIPDVEVHGARGTYCFTDGCGVAGDEVMKEAARALGVKTGINLFPSAVQFRLGGAKGVLTHCPEKAGPHEIRLRPSNIKFESALTQLNAVRLAKYQVAFLNRQFIIIMEANGIPKQLFVDLFRNAVISIKGLRERVRTRRTTKEDKRLISLCSEFPLGTLIKAGFNEDSLILDICSIIECRALQDLKWRARVELPTGVFLIGVADEYNCLREGEVFCQFQENEETEPRIIKADVLVCRAPALHPGDIRKARAVDRPELRHLKNVLVFSTQGKRDLPNMLGGGDLDGDDYTLIWDERFVKHLKEYQPMDYTAPPPIRVDRVTQTHLNENFCQYILNDVLGQVDNAHLALSDQYTPYDDRCLELSEVHSMAVDFAKTGQAATIEAHQRPKSWPDFMDPDGTRMNVYESKKILGELFRIVQPDPHFRPSDIKSMGYPADPRITKFPLFQTLLERLKPVKATYEHNLQYDLRRYKVSEPEVPCGIAVRNKKRKRMRDHNLMEPLRDSYIKHVEEARTAAMHAIAGINFTTSLTPAQIIARHCYALTYEREQVIEWEQSLMQGDWNAPTANNDDDGDAAALMPKAMTSFAWVFWQELVQLVTLD